MGSFSALPTPQVVGPPLIGSPRLFIGYISSYPSYLEAVSSIHYVRTHHTVVKIYHYTENQVYDKGKGKVVPVL